MFLSFNSTFMPLFVLGSSGMPRRVFTYAAQPAGLNDVGVGLGVRARLLDAGLPRELRLVAGLRARARPGQTRGARSRSSGSCPTPVPVHNFDRIPTFDPDADPYPYGMEAAARRASRGRAGEADDVTELARSTGYGARARAAGGDRRAALRVGAHLWSSATAFFFLAFLFAYFYLRSLEQPGQWHPHHVKAAGDARNADRRLRWSQRGCRRPWHATPAQATIAAFGLAGLAALALGLLAGRAADRRVRDDRFGPTDGGYASVFLGWTGLYLLFVLASIYWLETLVATSFRYRGAGASGHQPGEASGDRDRSGDDIAQPISLVEPGAEAFAFYWSVLAGIGAVTWAILYLL